MHPSTQEFHCQLLFILLSVSVSVNFCCCRAVITLGYDAVGRKYQALDTGPRRGSVPRAVDFMPRHPLEVHGGYAGLRRGDVGLSFTAVGRREEDASGSVDHYWN